MLVRNDIYDVFGIGMVNINGNNFGCNVGMIFVFFFRGFILLVFNKLVGVNGEKGRGFFYNIL